MSDARFPSFRGASGAVSASDLTEKKELPPMNTDESLNFLIGVYQPSSVFIGVGFSPEEALPRPNIPS